jgi:hypothetical protein
MSIDVTRNSAYAHLGEAWLRYQWARIFQRHLQLGAHADVLPVNDRIYSGPLL